MRTWLVRPTALLSLLLGLAFLPGNASAEDVKRALVFGEMDLPRGSLPGENRFSLRLGVHSFTVDGGDASDPALTAGIAWTGVMSPPLPEGVNGNSFASRWSIEGRLSAQFFDSPEGPAGGAVDLAGDVLFRRGVPWFSRPAHIYLGPSLRYGVLRMDRHRTADNGAVVRHTETLATDSISRMATVVAGLEIPLGKRFLLRPEARLGTDPSAWVALVFLPAPPATPAPPAAGTTTFPGEESLPPPAVEAAPGPETPSPAAAPAPPAPGEGGAPPAGGGEAPPPASPGNPSPGAEGNAPASPATTPE